MLEQNFLKEKAAGDPNAKYNLMEALLNLSCETPIFTNISDLVHRAMLNLIIMDEHYVKDQLDDFYFHRQQLHTIYQDYIEAIKTADFVRVRLDLFKRLRELIQFPSAIATNYGKLLKKSIYASYMQTLVYRVSQIIEAHLLDSQAQYLPNRVEIETASPAEETQSQTNVEQKKVATKR